jgi:rubrerythrin
MTLSGDEGARLADALEAARRSEKQQALTYRGMAARAEAANLAELAQRFHDLHADEQHHLSRLTARLLELGVQPSNLDGVAPVSLPPQGWEEEVRSREQAEIRLYEEILRGEIDPATRRLIETIIEVEVSHFSELGGKWTMA